MSKENFQLYPGRSLGGLVLGSHLKDVLDRLKSKSSEQKHLALDLAYSSSEPTTTPILLTLPSDGLRLRFDGLEQRLRLIEVLDFTKATCTYSGHDIFKASDGLAGVASGALHGPNHRTLSKLFGPTYPGEYIPPYTSEGSSHSCYVLSYPGVAFSFPVDPRKWSSDPDVISSLLASPGMIATSMAIFEGRSWAGSRNNLYKPLMTYSRPRGAVQNDVADGAGDVAAVKIYGEGRIEIVRQSSPSFWITLSETTPQDLVSELGPPDAIYQKNDRRLAIHRKGRSPSQVDASRMSVLTDESDEDNPAISADDRELASTEHFYNYFRLGLDILISQPTAASMASPTVPESQIFHRSQPAHFSKTHLTATKLLIHGNIPGAWNFNRYRRCRWTLEHVPTATNPEPLTSETKFKEISERLKDVFNSMYAMPEDSSAQIRGMSLNRGWGASPDSSCELLGGWEEEMPQEVRVNGNAVPEGLDTTSELFGFPGMVFEVLKNGTVSCLTVY